MVGGGVEKDGDASKARYFRLDFDRRIRDIISASKKAFLPASIRAPLGFFAEIYGGTRPFTFAAARQAADTLMQETAKYFPTLYSGIDDPLPLLTRLRSGRTDGPTRIETGLSSSEKRNIIVFGAPGTGKSRRLDLRKDSLLRDGGHFERVTFHPDYSYASFVGTYKPVPRPDVEGKDTITYEYVPGPFMRVLAAALINGKTENVRPHVLLIEEINRASAAAVFGDIFQLLDRDKSNVSEYPIHASADVQKCLADTVGGLPSDYEELRLPDNMFIWASMNSADQGVFPLDTAFKRRWEFEYIAIDENDNDLRGKVVTLGKDEWSHDVEWNELRKAINEFLATLGINEDKQIGPYFIRREVSVPAHGDRIETKGFVDAFQHKVLMYLFEDAARLHRKDLFDGCRLNRNRYSDVCREFEDKGVHLFHKNIVARVRSKPVKPEMSPASDDSTGVVGPGADAE